MNWEAIGAMGEIVGAAGVIVTLAYLAAQIKQNTQSNRNNAIQTISSTNGEWLALIAQDESIALMYTKGAKGLDGLEEPELTRYIALLMGIGRQYDTQYHLYCMGSVPEDLWQSTCRSIKFAMGSKGGREWWKLSRRLFSDQFREVVDELLASDSR